MPPRFGTLPEPPSRDTEPPDSWRQPVSNPQPTSTSCTTPPLSSHLRLAVSLDLLLLLLLSFLRRPTGLRFSPPSLNPLRCFPDRASPPRELSFEPRLSGFGPLFASWSKTRGLGFFASALTSSELH
ncbi:hypothetical protein Cni_G05231 [Canna indica]|uniref:Uncharacterized protein n=1 Tax=Canna indica TaxID=4628 RepID=A0AAQ3JWM9_9LILI|nr:hypothetical protein Cni_G05231 [Canna indica]